jgi:hypothetical protein
LVFVPRIGESSRAPLTARDTSSQWSLPGIVGGTGGGASISYARWIDRLEGTGIPALSEAQAAGYLDGKAMWHASVAELHHYPSPRRVFELAEALELTEGQRRATTKLHEETRREAIRLGTELVALEQRLNRIFAWNQATADNIAKIVLDIGTLKTQLRLTHLVASIRQKPLLTEKQVRRYDELQGRGMDSGKSSNEMGCNGAHHHGR